LNYVHQACWSRSADRASRADASRHPGQLSSCLAGRTPEGRRQFLRGRQERARKPERLCCGGGRAAAGAAGARATGRGPFGRRFPDRHRRRWDAPQVYLGRRGQRRLATGQRTGKDRRRDADRLQLGDRVVPAARPGRGTHHRHRANGCLRPPASSASPGYRAGVRGVPGQPRAAHLSRRVGLRPLYGGHARRADSPHGGPG
jgi:hypothetical protein